MIKKTALLLLSSCLFSLQAHAQGAAPEMFGVREIVINFAHFDDAEASDACGLSRDQVAGVLTKALAGTGVPVISIVDAKPMATGVARINLIPEISTHSDENLGCVSWVSLSAESHARLSIPPVNTLRGVTVLYWRQHTVVSSGQSIHEQRIDEVLQKMAGMFAQQYKLDQPPEISQ